MIAITGATGFLGSNLIPKLKDKKVKCLVRKYIDNNKIDPVVGDINDIVSVNKLLEKTKVLIHLAAAIDSKNKEYYYKINVQGTKNLIDSCKKNKVKRIIFVSSMASTKDYLDDYGKSKKEAEDLIRKSGLDYTILRPSFIYGKNSNSMKKMINFINSFKFIPIVGNGEYTLNPVHVDDVVKSIISCINSKKSIKKTYDILGKSEISFNEFINAISEKYNIQKRKIHIPIPICLVISSVGSILGPSFPLKKSFVLSLESKYKGTIASAERDLNYHPISFKEGLNK